MQINRRKFIVGSTVAVGGIAATALITKRTATKDTVQVGSIFSLTGGLSITEKTMADATRMAIAEINAKGGVLGKQIELILEDGASDPKTYNEKASKLVLQDKVQSVFACYTSASRKAVLPVFERRGSLLFYPTFYEGYECSKNVIYTGAVPNQQLSNYIPWLVKKQGKKKFFIVGSNYLFPREMAKVSKSLIEQNGAQWIADEYLELGYSQWASMVSKIKNSGCDAVISNVVGDSLIAFYKEFRNQGLTHDKVPICSTVTSEVEVAAMGPEYAAGSFTSFPYFQSIDTPRNRDFVQRYRAFVKDPQAVTHDPLHSSYFQVYLWKAAVEKARDFSADAIRAAIGGLSYDAPGGTVTINAENLHTAHTPRIAQWQADGSGKIVNQFPGPVQPLPYSAYGETEGNLYCTVSGLDTAKLPK